MNAWGELFALAAQQRGVITLGMAAEVGLSAQAVRDRAAKEGWHRIARGVWLAPGSAPTWQAEAQAHLLLLGERAVLSHATAAHLHGLHPASPAPIEILVPADRRPCGSDGLVVRRSRNLVAGDITEVDGLRATTIPRTLRDQAFDLGWSGLYDRMTEAEQRRLATPDEFRAMANRLHHGRGSGTYRDVVSQRTADRSDSALERDTRDAARGGGFEPSAGPFPIWTPARKRLWLDVAFAPIWFAMECDGLGFHSGRRAFERDRERWRLIQRAGWKLTWVTRKRLREDLAGILEEIAEAHRTADPSRPPAAPAA